MIKKLCFSNPKAMAYSLAGLLFPQRRCMMRRTLTLSATALATTLLTAPAAQAADLVLGKKLHSENCLKCHGTEKYSAPNRKVHSMSALKTRVQGCATNLSLSWFEDEVDAVAAYMNQEFYKFK